MTVTVKTAFILRRGLHFILRSPCYSVIIHLSTELSNMCTYYRVRGWFRVTCM